MNESDRALRGVALLEISVCLKAEIKRGQAELAKRAAMGKRHFRQWQIANKHDLKKADARMKLARMNIDFWDAESVLRAVKVSGAEMTRRTLEFLRGK